MNKKTGEQPGNKTDMQFKTIKKDIYDIDALIDERFGKEGTPERVEAEERAYRFYNNNKQEDMTEYEKKLQELKSIMNLTDPKSTEKKEKLLRWLEANSDDDASQASLDAFIENGIAEERKDISAILSRLAPSV